MDFSEGAIISVHCSGSTDDVTNFGISYNSTAGVYFERFVSIEQLAASATPAPQYEYPDEEGFDPK